MWVDHNNITLPEPFVETLKTAKLFTDKEVEEILNAAKEKEWKDKLLANTQKVLDLGAFGAPWMWVRNSEGTEEPFFGSDRYVSKKIKIGEMSEQSANAEADFILSGRFWAFRSGTSRSSPRGTRKRSCDYVYDTTEIILAKPYSTSTRLFLLNNNLLVMLA
jgi:hypothetical protein